MSNSRSSTEGETSVAGHARHARKLVAGAIALLLAVPAASSATTSKTAATQPVATLAGTTTLVGDRSASMLVRVPRTTAFVNEIGDPSSPAGMTADKAGPSGFVLKSEKARGPEYIGSMSPDGFKLKYHLAGFDSPRDDRGLYRIPPGVYRLYLVTQHRGTKLTLRFKGLSGAQTLKPRKPAQGLFQTPKPDWEGTAGKFAYSIGENADIESDNAIFQMSALVRHDIHAESVHDNCYYRNGKSHDGPYCPSPYAQNYPAIVSFETVDGLTHGLYATGSIRGGALGPKGIGYSLTTTTPAAQIGYHNMWLALEDPPE